MNFHHSPRTGGDRPLTVLTPPDTAAGKKRAPSGEGGYVIMSPGVGIDDSINEEPASRAALEESLGKLSFHDVSMYFFFY